MATQLSVIRGDYLCTQTINLSSNDDNFTDLSCTGQIRTHPDGPLIHQFTPDIIYAEYLSGQVQFDISGQFTRNFPPINLYGDVHFFSTGIKNQTYWSFRLNVLPDVTHL